MKKMTLLALALMMICIESTAWALTSKDVAGNTWIFAVNVMADGSMELDYDKTVKIDKVYTKTELKDLLTATDQKTKKQIATQLASFGNIGLYRFADDSILQCMFDTKTQVTQYCYWLPNKIEPYQE